MWVEAILSKEDLEALVAKMTPLTLRLDDDQGDFHLSDPSEITLVPDVGLRVVCKAKLRWPVLGVDVPVALHSLIVILRPEIAKTDGGDTLVFKLVIEHADLAGVPRIIDDRITQKVNDALAEKHVELAWNFAETLSHAFSLPALLDPVEAIALKVAWGRIKVTSDALVLAVSFHSSVLRRDDGAPRGTAEREAPTRAEEPMPPRRYPRPAARPARRIALAIASGLLAVAAGSGYALGRTRRAR